MTEIKTIAILGATGAQGGGLARAILDDPAGGFTVRAITRDVNSTGAQALARQGAKVVAADVDDEASLARAFAGAHGVYAVTFFWAHFSPEKEPAQAGNIARAARAAGVRHAIWSTLEDTRRWVPLESERMPTLMGNYKVPHFDAKGEPPTGSSRKPGCPRRSCSLPSTGTTSSTSAWGRRRARTARSRSRCPWATRSCRGSPRRTSAAAPTGSSRPDAAWSARPSAWPEST